MTAQRLVGLALALFAVSPLINVGPVNLTSFLLLTTSGFYCIKNPGCFWSFWRAQKRLLLVMSLLLVAFAVSNILNHVTSPVEATFSQGRWLVLFLLSAPAVALGLDVTSGQKILQFVIVVLLIFVGIYLADAISFLVFDSGGVLDLVNAERGDPNRPSWVFNPHPFSRTLIAGLLLLIGVFTATTALPERAACILGIVGVCAMLVLGAVRTAFIALVAVGLISIAVYGGKRSVVVFVGGLLLAGFGLEFRERLFQESLHDESLGIRFMLIQDGARAFLQQPWFGGGYQAARSVIWSPELEPFIQTQTLGTTNTHVQWLEMCVSYGVTGGILFIALWVYSGWWIYVTYRRATAGFQLFKLLLVLNWVSLTVAGFSTVYRETEWALWTITMLGAAWLQVQQLKARR